MPAQTQGWSSEPSTDRPILAQLAEVDYSYGRRAPLVFNRLSLTLDHRSVVLIGPNGAGKSSLLKLISGQYQPRRGTVRVQCTIGYCAQRTVALPAFRVREQVKYAGWLAGRSRRASTRSAGVAIDVTGLGALASRPARTLSGGQAQRMGIACALAAEPQLLLLDEPTASLDPVARAGVNQVLTDLTASGLTVISSSHTAVDVGPPYGRLVMLDDGAVIYDGTPSDFLSDSHSHPTAVEFARALHGR